MASIFSKLNFFNQLDARARVFVLFGAVIGVVALIYVATRYVSNENKAIGPSQVAATPAGLRSVPGGTLNPEYARVLEQANTQSTKRAVMTGDSAIPTALNYGGQTTSSANCNIICTDQSANVKYDLDDWTKAGKINPDVSTIIQELADKNTPIGDFTAQLNDLLQQNKLTAEQARELLAQYKKQHANDLLQGSASVMDELIKANKLPLDLANLLLMAQKSGASPSEYARMLRELQAAGKIDANTSQRLLSQYADQYAKEVVNQSISSLHDMTRKGLLLPDIEKELIDLETRMVPVDVYAATLDRYVAEGKLVPAVAGKILDEFKAQKASMSISGSIPNLIQAAETAAYTELKDLVKAGKITTEVADQLRGLIQQNVDLSVFTANVDELTQAGKLTPEIAKLKIADYRLVKGLRDMSKQLEELQANNASPATYKDTLKRYVQALFITPDQASQLLQEYQSSTITPTATASASDGATTEEFAELQKRIEANTEAPPPATVTTTEFSEAQKQISQQDQQSQQASLDALRGAMSNQAAQLVSAWQAEVMEHKEGTPERKETAATDANKANATATTTGTTTAANAATDTPPLIKAGSVLFAVLDTAINSDYPDSPAMATIVDGPLKGAKLLGKLIATKGVSGQLDRVNLNFTLMNSDTWIKSKTVTAYAIDPDTARTVLASNVDYHYMQRFGAMMATSFMQGYASAITQAGTSTTGIFGTSTTNPALSPSEKIATALGKMGQAVGDATQNYVNMPPTVRVDAGVGLGILFMTDVT